MEKEARRGKAARRRQEMKRKMTIKIWNGPRTRTTTRTSTNDDGAVRYGFGTLWYG